MPPSDLVQHPYCYKGTNVFRNKEGLRDQAALDRFERTASGLRILTITAKPMTSAGFRAIHRHLLRDVYEWAGRYRYIDTGRGPAPFCLAEHIPANMERRFAKLTSRNFLKGTTVETFAVAAAEDVNELNAIHPFLDGNGRTTRCFLRMLAEQAGHRVDIGRIAAAAWNEASRIGFYRGDHGPMADIISAAMVPL